VIANPNDVKRPNRLFWLAAAVILVIAALSRFAFLPDKAFHHDESLHAYYSHRVALGNPHEYSALLHGPFLYYFTGAVMWLVGSNDFIARGAAALFGVLLVALPLLLRHFWGRAATLTLMAIFLVSPTFLYFGRFLREDGFTSVWALGTVLGGLLFWRERKPWALYFSTAMLAFHFVNKENSYLHVFLWLLALGAIAFMARKLPAARPAYQGEAFSNADRNYLLLNAFSIFATIYILFYSSFFRHSKGSLHGILDGLYRESLLYWWDQNQKRRIDGPFDYHLPLLANYEFLLLPFLMLAWYRVVAVSRGVAKTIYNSRGAVLGCAVLALACFVVPRVALVPDACSYTAVCLDSVAKGLGDVTASIFKHLHVAHSRHVLQILAYIAFGATAFFSALALRRKTDALFWFWLTGAIGVYSYVGEKVPWLLVYILLPLAVLVALEVARTVRGRQLALDDALLDAQLAQGPVASREAALSRAWRYAALAWVVVALPFTLFKGYRAAFLRPDDPHERLVFTQTTNVVKQVRDRWRATHAAKKTASFKVGMYGDATWPFAWYAEEFDAGDFSKPTPELAKNLDVILLDQDELEQAKKDFPEFTIYSLSMRHWWVPGQDPTLAQILRYFFRGEYYPRMPDAPETDTGYGDTKILYLEKRGSVFFEGSAPPDFLPLLAEATAK